MRFLYVFAILCLLPYFTSGSLMWAYYRKDCPANEKEVERNCVAEFMKYKEDDPKRCGTVEGALKCLQDLRDVCIVESDYWGSVEAQQNRCQKDPNFCCLHPMMSLSHCDASLALSCTTVTLSILISMWKLFRNESLY